MPGIEDRRAGRRVLFVVNGTGLGNSTRCHAIIRMLHEKNIAVDVATFGNGLSYFESQREISRLYRLRGSGYSTKRPGIGILALGIASVNFVAAGLHNGITLAKIILDRKPRVIVYDSFYNLIGALLGGRTLISLNNSDQIIEKFRAMKAKPWTVYPHFLAVECLDYLFQRIFPDLVISPWFMQIAPVTRGKFHRVGPIVRTGFSANVPECSKGAGRPKVVILHSGSALGPELPLDFLDKELDACEVAVIGRNGQSRKGVQYYGRMEDPEPLLRGADVLVTNGGFSSLCEGLALGKRMLILPIEGHAEQFVNARAIEEMGVALCLTPKTFSNSVRGNLRESLDRLGAQERSGSCGAREAARLIAERFY